MKNVALTISIMLYIPKFGDYLKILTDDDMMKIL